MIFFINQKLIMYEKIYYMKVENIKKGLLRILTPQFVVTLVYLLKYGAKVSPKSEVDLTQNLKLGKGCTISSFTKVKAFDGVLKMGDRGGIATNCFLAAGEGGIEIGDNFICGPNVSIVANNYRHDQKGVHLEDQGSTSKGIKIGNNVWVGAGCVILDGAQINDNTIVVANSTVSRRYKPNVIIQGSPAKVIMNR
jgi:acetyltransferase-like isoleucine patch superfamily enzyme